MAEERSKSEIEHTILAVQDQDLATKWRLDLRNDQETPLCRICNKVDETIAHIMTCPTPLQVVTTRTGSESAIVETVS